MKTVTLTIEGMTCEHCVRAVRGALDKVPATEVESVEIGSATVKYDPTLVNEETLVEAVADEGYTAYERDE
ncbi:MAG TPA: heavy-metal-associated domain-containing protein [Gemmatimonadaceae bacterium]|nr:heavy-metal-associated domain-containing protein [Gemmatimonadaceae bacterium]